MLCNPYIALSSSAWFLVPGMQQLCSCSGIGDFWALSVRVCPILCYRLKNPSRISCGSFSPGCTDLSALYCKWATFSTNCFSTKRCHGILMATDGHSFCFMSYLSPPPPLKAPPEQHHAPLGTGWGESGLRWVRAARSTPLLPVAHPGCSFPNTEPVGCIQI